MRQCVGRSVIGNMMFEVRWNRQGSAGCPATSAHHHTTARERFAMASAADLAADIADMESLLAKAERPKVRALLGDYLQQLRAEQATRTTAASVIARAPAPAPERPAP